MVDKLQVDLIAGNAAKAPADVKNFENALVKADTTAKGLKGAETWGNNWDKEVAAVERRTRNLAFELKNIGDVSFKTAGMAGIGKAAQAAEAEVRGAYARLRQLEQAAASTKDPVVLQKLQAEANATIATLDKLERKIDNVSAGRKAAAARGPGSISAAGASGLLNQAGAAGVPFAGEAAGLVDLGAGLGVTSAGVAAAGSLAAVGLLIVKYSKEARQEAEVRLHMEEAIAIAANKQIKAQKDALTIFKEQDAAAEHSAQLQRSLAANNDKATLERRRDLLRKLRDMDPTGPLAKQFDADAEANASRARQVEEQKTAEADKNFAANFERFKKNQEAEREAEKKRRDDINEGKKAVDDYGKSIDELFGKLFAAQGAANPFVKVYTEAQAAIAATRIATAGLSEDLQKQALVMTQTANANVLFQTRLDARLRSSDLRADAQGLRGKPFVDPSMLPLLQDVGGFNKFVDRGLDQFKGTDVQGYAAFLKNAIDKARPADDQSVSARLDRQLKVIADLRPENEFQRAEADRKIIALTQGVKPEDLTDAQRNAAASARENEASRLDNAEKDARAQREAAAAVQANIDANIQRLADIAERDGLQGVIRIINDAEDVARDSLGQRRRASPADAKSLMD
jgi:hypothetical protein